MAQLQFPLSDYEMRQMKIIEEHLVLSPKLLELSDEENSICFDILSAMKERGIITDTGIDNWSTAYFVTGSFTAFKEWIDVQNNKAMQASKHEGGIIMAFEPLSSNCEALLDEIITHRDEQKNCDLPYWQHRFESIHGSEEDALRSQFRILREREMISVLWSSNVPYRLSVLDNGLSYSEMKEAYRLRNSGTNNITLSNVGKVNIQSIDNSVTYNVTENDLSQIQKMIEAAKGLDNEELVIDSINQLKDSIGKPSYLEKYNTFMQNAANHMTVFAPFIPFLTDLITRLPK